MNVKGLSRLFSIYFIVFFISFNLFPTPGLSQTKEDVDKAVKNQDVKGLIKIYKKASKKGYYYYEREALKSIRDMNNPLVFDDMIIALKDEHFEIRSAAATALGKMKDPRIIDPLIVALNDYSEKVRRSVAYALAETNDLRVVKPLARGITYENWRKNTPQLPALKKMGQMIEMPLIEALNDEDPLLRGGAALVLGNLKFTSATESLISLLKDENTNVRRLALLGLVMMKDSLSVELLISVALMNSDAEARKIATKAVLNMKNPNPLAVEIYIDSLNSDNRYTMSAAAANLLKLDTPRAVEFHLEAYKILLNGKDEKMRIKAAKALLHLKDPIPDDIRARALKVIDEESFIKLFIVYDKYQRKDVTHLDNIDGRMIAKQIYEYHDYNNTLISRTVTIDSDSKDTLRITNYNNYGRLENYMYFCLDKKGNIIKNGSEPVLVKLYQFEQKEKSKIGYIGFSKVKSYEIRKIYPCQDCVEKTSIESCRYVW
jgi:HEAT repeat protein